MFALYWWVFGIILPKVYASRGDNQWGRPLKDLDVVFQIYANGEITCVGGMAFVLSTIIIYQTFPDLIIVKEASNLNTLQLYRWFQISFLQTYLAGWVTVQQDSEGKWIKARGLKTWRLQKTLDGVTAELQPPTRDTLYPLWEQVQWPSVSCGGPVSFHQARWEFLKRYHALRIIDPKVWVSHHEDKKHFWRYGLSEIQLTAPVKHPVYKLGLMAGPGLESQLPLAPSTWTKSLMAQHSVFEMRTDRMLALEFMGEHLDQAVEVLNFSILNPKGFGSVIASKWLIRTVNDIRDFLRHANIPFLVPSPDPYNTTAHEDRKAAKLAHHFVIPRWKCTVS